MFLGAPGTAERIESHQGEKVAQESPHHTPHTTQPSHPPKEQPKNGSY